MIRMQDLRSMAICLLLVPVLLGLTVTCKKSVEEATLRDVEFAVPASVSLEKGQESLDFRVQFQKAPLASDVIVLTDGAGNKQSCPILETSVTSFSVSIRHLWGGFLADGPYQVAIRRGSEEMTKGTMMVNVLIPGDGVEPAAGSTVYGLVSCEGVGIPNVVVSDGFAVVRTDGKGVYQMNSKKKHGYVFVSIPSGYEAVSDGIRPLLYKQLAQTAINVERVDFSLRKVSGQDKHTLLVFGDIHLANRNEDLKQFNAFVADVNQYVSTHAGDKIYGLTLGDMTWDLYWKDNKYSFAEYLSDANAIKGIQIFHTIGNHDHSMYFTGDFDTVTEYKQKVAPTYYSFNIGQVHYVVLDDIECTNSTPASGRTDGAYTRNYNCTLVSEQLQWLTNDLSFVPKTTPVVIAMHAPLYTAAGTYSLTAAEYFEHAVKDYQVQLFTGHTHKVYNVSRGNTFEHNAGAVCATWWWSGHLTPGVHVGTDGAPGGYTVTDIDGTSFKWVFKATGKDAFYQFRSYDRNAIEISPEKYITRGDADHKKALARYTASWASASNANEVYLNIWNWDPSWTVEVKEGGVSLPVERLSAEYDPLHIIAYTAKRLDSNVGFTSAGGINFETGTNPHMFRVKATAPDSTLEIKVTDRFGTTYTESMKRPKAFSTDQYK